MPERELLGDHAAHRYAEHVGGHRPEGVQQRSGVFGELGGRVWPDRRVRLAAPTVVVGDDSARGSQGVGDRQPVGDDGRNAGDQQQRATLAAVLVVQANTTCGGEGHPVRRKRASSRSGGPIRRGSRAGLHELEHRRRGSSVGDEHVDESPAGGADDRLDLGSAGGHSDHCAGRMQLRA
jgi:hypothetical protein